MRWSRGRVPAGRDSIISEDLYLGAMGDRELINEGRGMDGLMIQWEDGNAG